MTVATTFTDVLAAFRRGTDASASAWKAFSNTLKNLNNADVYKATTKAMATSLGESPDLIKRFTSLVDDDTLTAVLKNAEPDVARTLVKNMDQADLARVARVDPDLARTLNIQNVQVPGLADSVVRQGGTTAQAKNVADATPELMKSQGAINAGKTKTVTSQTARDVPLAAADDVAEETTVTWVRNQGGVADSVTDADLASAITNGGKIAENSSTVRKALEKLGIIAVGSDIAKFTRKNWMKIGAGMVILCMMYDTNNPFTALDRALEDIDEVVDGMKDLADAAFNAAKNAAEGGFDLIAFLTQNWWMSLICCFVVVFIGIAATLS